MSQLCDPFIFTTSPLKAFIASAVEICCVCWISAGLFSILVFRLRWNKVQVYQVIGHQICCLARNMLLQTKFQIYDSMYTQHSNVLVKCWVRFNEILAGISLRPVHTIESWDSVPPINPMVNRSNWKQICIMLSSCRSSLAWNLGLNSKKIRLHGSLCLKHTYTMYYQYMHHHGQETEQACGFKLCNKHRNLKIMQAGNLNLRCSLACCFYTQTWRQSVKEDNPCSNAVCFIKQ